MVHTRSGISYTSYETSYIFKEEKGERQVSNFKPSRKGNVLNVVSLGITKQIVQIKELLGNRIKITTISKKY